MVELAVIGGTSLSEISGFELEEERFIDTPYGSPSEKIKIGTLGSKKIAFLNRHGEAGSIAPHKINYRANIFALKSLEAKNILAVNAVGGIGESCGPRHISIPKQLIDYTYGREHTYYDGLKTDGFDSLLEFVDFTFPFSDILREKLVKSAQDLITNKNELTSDTCYGCTQGPRLETAAEIQRLKTDGCDLVGMTLMPEAGLAREADLNYATICLVVNWAAGLAGNDIISIDEIMQVAREGGEKVQQIIANLLEDL